METRITNQLFLGVLFVFLLAPGFALASEQFNDADALQGVKTAKVLFDINVSKPSKLEFYLPVIKQTHQDLIRQGVTPDIVIAFRGASVRLITSENWSFSDEDQKLLQQSGEYLKELHDLGVKIEACSIATGLFQVENEKLLPGVTVVGNTFVSLAGYQSRGYNLIPIQ